MKRYMIFSGENYYPAGGMEDFVTSSDDIDEAIATAKEEVLEHCWVSVFDSVEMMELFEGVKR